MPSHTHTHPSLRRAAFDPERMQWLKAGRAVAGILATVGFVVLYLAPYVESTNPKPALITAILFITLIGALLGVDTVLPKLMSGQLTTAKTGGDTTDQSGGAETTGGDEAADQSPTRRPLPQDELRAIYREAAEDRLDMRPAAQPGEDSATTDDADSDNESESESDDPTST